MLNRFMLNRYMLALSLAATTVVIADESPSSPTTQRATSGTQSATSSTQPAPSTAPAHDPAVFRCVLDGHPRMLVMSFTGNLWAAYDTQTCQLYKVWRGDVNFTGTVYDTRHGPQPSVRGEILWQNKTTPATKPSTKWIGYRVDGVVVTLMTEVDGRAAQIRVAPESATEVSRDEQFGSLPIRIESR
jgi:hypothetical protein